MTYKKSIIKIHPFNNTAREILIAQLSELGYESFLEINDGLEAYIPSNKFTPINDQTVSFLSSEFYVFEISTEDLEEKNWNEEWKKNYFKPILIGKQCLVRPTFHESQIKAQYEILIEPRMAFGTGYHETTSLMIEHLLELDITQKRVLDMGCGTGILGILASMRGASKVEGIDIDSWAVENAKDNIQLNNIPNMQIVLGDASAIPNQESFHLFLANINRNILLNDLNKYDAALIKGGTIILSGFYTEDF
jgi:ribosomal protein L11 methyltransferase